MPINFTPDAAPQSNGGGVQPVPSSATINFMPDAPKLPDTSAMEDAAHRNLTQPTEGGAPQSPAERLNTAAGFPVTTALKGNDIQFTPDVRRNITNAYANGTASNVGDFMQSALHSILPIVATGVQNMSRAGTYEANTLKGAASDISEVFQPFHPDNPQDSTIRKGIEALGQYVGGPIFGTVGAVISPISTAASVASRPITNLVEPNATESQKQRLDQAIGGAVTNVGLAASGALTRGGTEFPSGAGPWDNIEGSHIIKSAVGDALGKDPSSVTSADVDKAIADGFKNHPAAKDFEDTAVVMGNPELADGLRNIYAETGVHPDQVYADAKLNPSIAMDLANGEIPKYYQHLISPITPEVQAAMDRMEAARQENPPIQRSTEGATASSNPLQHIFNPVNISESAMDMATALRQGRGPENQAIAQAQASLEPYAKTINAMSDADRLKFIDYIENRATAEPLANPELQGLANIMRDIYARYGQRIQQEFPDVALREDYFTHQYEDEAAAKRFFSDWAAKQGSERSLQQRAFPTLKEAVGAGLKPKTTNPIETVMGYARNMSNLFAAKKSLNLAQESGIADYFPKGEQPDGWVPLGGNLAEQGDKILYAPEDAARIYNNDISKGFTGPAGDIVQAAQRINNFNNMLLLGVSTYHATLTTLSNMAKEVGIALTMGSPAERAEALARSLPGVNAVRGGKFVEGYLGREQLTPDMQQAMDALVRNNAVNIKLQDYWKSGPAKTYLDVWQHGAAGTELAKAAETIKEHPVVGIPMVAANEIGRVMNTISAPLFDYYIPRMKLAAMMDEMHAWLRDHQDATPEEIDKQAQQIGNSSDNAFGEMIRDNLFWHNITRQTLQTLFLSYSWITGAARMLKGIPDIGKTILRQQELTPDARYLIGMAATYATINGVRTYLGTGHAPNQFLDYIYPRTGGETPQGQEERELLPSHIGQFTQYANHGIYELGNEASPTLKLLWHLLSNQDYRGLPITDENNDWFSEQRWDDYTNYILGEETPIGIKTFLQGAKAGSKISLWERIFGVRQAPREITDPEGYKEMMEKVHESEWKKKLRSDERIKEQYGE